MTSEADKVVVTAVLFADGGVDLAYTHIGLEEDAKTQAKAHLRDALSVLIRRNLNAGKKSPPTEADDLSEASTPKAGPQARSTE